MRCLYLVSTQRQQITKPYSELTQWKNYYFALHNKEKHKGNTNKKVSISKQQGSYEKNNKIDISNNS
jgi:hypothetical protein